MSLLPATSHANPTTPFWASASGGGGGGGPVVVVEDLTGGTTSMLTFNDTEEIFSFPFPTGVEEGDDFILQVTMLLDDYDQATAGDFSGLLEFIALFNDDDKLWGVTNSTYIAQTTGFPTTYSPVALTLVAHRGVNASNISLVFRNKVQQTNFQILNITATQITLTKIGTGLVYTPPPP